MLKRIVVCFGPLIQELGYLTQYEVTSLRRASFVQNGDKLDYINRDPFILMIKDHLSSSSQFSVNFPMPAVITPENGCEQHPAEHNNIVLSRNLMAFSWYMHRIRA